ncbi:hypothetical protein D3C81_2189720 [compost metagenome]
MCNPIRLGWVVESARMGMWVGIRRVRLIRWVWQLRPLTLVLRVGDQSVVWCNLWDQASRLDHWEPELSLQFGAQSLGALFNL